MNSLTEGLSSETTRELLCLFHEAPIAAEQWAFLRRQDPSPDRLEELALLMLRTDAEEAHERSQNFPQPSTLRPIATIQPSDPRVEMASAEYIRANIAKASFILARQPSKDQLMMVAEVLTTTWWTRAEIDHAWKAVVSEPDISERVVFVGAIIPAHFEAARLLPKVAMGRLHTEAQARKFADELAGEDISRRNRILGTWFAPCIWQGERMFTLETIADATHV